MDGKVKLLKKQHKKISESWAYSAATTVKNIVDNISYFIFENDKLKSIKKDKKSLISALANKEAAQQYLSAAGVSIKKGEDLVKAVEKYSLLF